MGTATVEETEQERIDRENAEQAERLAALDAEQEALDNDTPAQGEVRDGQTGAEQRVAPPEDLLVAGTTQLELLPSFGGKRPTGCTVSIGGVSGIPVMAGQAYEKGQYVRFEGVALIESANEKDKVDRKAGVAVDCKVAFKAHASDVRVFAASGPRLPENAGLEERVATAIELLESGEPDVGTVVALLRQEA